MWTSVRSSLVEKERMVHVRDNDEKVDPTTETHLLLFAKRSLLWNQTFN